MNNIEMNHKNLVNDIDDLEVMREAGRITENEYYKCAFMLYQDINERFCKQYDLTAVNELFYQERNNILENFIASKSLETELNQYLKENGQSLIQKFYDCCNTTVNFCDYLKSKSESLTKKQLDDYITAKELLNLGV